MRIHGFWRQGAGSIDDPNNGRLIFRILGLHPGTWMPLRGFYPPHLRRTPLGYVRLAYNEFVRRYCCEVCRRCGRKIGGAIDTWWHTDDELYKRVIGHDGGTFCVRCFVRAARDLGIATMVQVKDCTRTHHP